MMYLALARSAFALLLATAVGTLASTSALPAQQIPKEALASLEREIDAVEASVAKEEFRGARASAAAAWQAVEHLPKAATETAEVATLIARLGEAAQAARELRVAQLAWSTVLGYRERTLSDHHRDLQEARAKLAATKYALGDLEGALALEEKVHDVLSRALGEKHPDHRGLQAARANLAGTMKRLGDLEGALALEEKVNDVLSRTLGETHPDHPDLQRARLNLAATRYALGDLQGALALEDKVHDVLSRTLGEKHPDHPDLQAARASLAITMKRLGDLEGALALEDKVHDVLSRTLGEKHPDHPDLQAARANLAITRRELGDLDGAQALFEAVHDVLSRTLGEKHPDHPDLQRARANLAATRLGLGDLEGALALQEKVHDVRSRTLGEKHPDHRDLQAARANLAATRYALGDLEGALALQEEVLEVLSRTLGEKHPDHPELQKARANLASTRAALGDLEGALALEEKVHDVLSRTLGEKHPDHLDLQVARLNLATTKKRLGDLEGALALEEKVHDVLSRTLGEKDADHPELQAARANLACTKAALGDLNGAQALFEAVHDALSRTLGEKHPDHPELQKARLRLAWTLLSAGSSERAVDLARTAGAIGAQSVCAWTLSPRAIGAKARQELPALSLSLTLGLGSGATARVPGLAGRALLTSQVLRGAETRAVRLAWRARRVEPDRTRQLETELASAVAKVSRVASAQVEGKGSALQANLRARNERLWSAVYEKERLQHELLALAKRGGGFDAAAVTIEQLAQRLPEGRAAAAIVGYSHRDPDREHIGRTIDEDRLVALLLSRNGEVMLHELGPREAIEAHVEALRELCAHDDTPADSEDLQKAQTDLCRAVLGPILDAVGDVDALYLAVHEALELVPLDALPLDDGEPVGARIQLFPLVSLMDLMEQPTASVVEHPTLLAMGGIAYENPPTDPGIVLRNAAVPVTRTRSGEPRKFDPLPETQPETKRVKRLFGKAFPAGRSVWLTGADAGKGAMAELAPDVTFLHVATHGYFAPETVKSTADPDPTPLAVRLDHRVSGLSPLVLTGLALAGANLPSDDVGRVPGIMTAEEILGLDLSRCYLVTLSACDTSLGVRRAGQCYASLRAAMLGAGARYVLTSLWEVNDAATMALMSGFYRRLWSDKMDPHRALWEAKMEARENGEPFRNWSGWLLTGR
ncbi:MAG: tetratricopeptide repeat protein [Planctomycetota bacterium]